jgi:hypothetical protein
MAVSIRFMEEKPRKASAQRSRTVGALRGEEKKPENHFA